MERPELPNEFRFEVRLRTRWVDEDAQQVLNNAVYLTLMEEARHAYFSRLDLLDGNRFPFVLGQVNASFLAPGRGGTDVLVRAATVSLGRTSFEQAYRIVEAASGVVWCEAVARLVAWDAGRRAKAPLGREFRAALVEFEGLCDPAD